jgi:hypothetical protein
LDSIHWSEAEGWEEGVELSDGDEGDRGYCYWVIGPEFHLMVAGVEGFYFLVGDKDGFYFLVSRNDEVFLLAGEGDRFYVLVGALNGALSVDASHRR